jgi:phosphoglycerol transferase
MICILGFLDQVPKYDSNIRDSTIQNYKIEKDFIAEIEKRINGQGVIYQLPYMPFPEVPSLYKMDTYTQLTPIIISNSLISNVAGMKGREVSGFYERLSFRTIDQQVEVLIKMGFDGIYLDKRGYADAGEDIANDIEGNKFVKWKISRQDGQVSFYAF